MTDSRGLTARQRRILDAIVDLTDAHGYPPTVREIGDAVGLASTSSVAHQIRVLTALGRLDDQRAPGRPRALRVVGGRPEDELTLRERWLSERGEAA